MKKPFTLLTLGEARKKLAFVLAVDRRGHNDFRIAKALLRSGYGRKLGDGYPLRLEDDVQEAV
jgi:hypothetical protein